MKIRYRYIEDNNLLVLKLEGDFSISDYYNFGKKIVKMEFWPFVKGILSDVRNIHPSDVNEHFDAILTFRKEIFTRNYLNVFLVNTPDVTASAHLYQEALRKGNFDYQYCSTMKQALIYLNAGYSESEMENMINNLKFEIDLLE